MSIEIKTNTADNNAGYSDKQFFLCSRTCDCFIQSKELTIKRRPITNKHHQKTVPCQ